jgi:23S rRNA pseudouridine1911/1915/1917 synthase
VRLLADSADAGQRLDVFLHLRLPDFSRSRIQAWIKAGQVLVDGAPARASSLLRAGAVVDATPTDPPPLHAAPEPIALTILYEDRDVVAIDKPAGMVVHAGAGVHSGTLVNALLHRFSKLSEVGGADRPGIVHRLDRYTSGVLLVARNDAAHRNLAAQFSGRRVEKVYIALVEGRLAQETARIERPITRDPTRRTRMTARLDRGRPAWSEYRVIERFHGFTLLEVRIGTGRTHQIRAHLASIRHPVAGDSLYGAKPAEAGRYFLHSHLITFAQPSTGEPITVCSPLPPDLRLWLNSMKKE